MRIFEVIFIQHFEDEKHCISDNYYLHLFSCLSWNIVFPLSKVLNFSFAPFFYFKLLCYLILYEILGYNFGEESCRTGYIILNQMILLFFVFHPMMNWCFHQSSLQPGFYSCQNRRTVWLFRKSAKTQKAEIFSILIQVSSLTLEKSLNFFMS